MSILSPSQKVTFLARLSQSDTANLAPQPAADVLNAAPMVANPSPQPQVPRPFGATTLTLAIDATRRGNVKPYLPAIAPLIALQDVTGISQWAAELVVLGDLQQADADAINAVLNTTMPDPSWPATVHGPNWVQLNFPGVRFAHPNTDFPASPMYAVGFATPAMVTEARS